MNIVEKTCPRCKKNFIKAPEHLYKAHGYTFCSYNCWNGFLTEKENKKQKTIDKQKAVC